MYIYNANTHAHTKTRVLVHMQMNLAGAVICMDIVRYHSLFVENGLNIKHCMDFIFNITSAVCFALGLQRIFTGH